MPARHPHPAALARVVPTAQALATIIATTPRSAQPPHYSFTCLRAAPPLPPLPQSLSSLCGPVCAQDEQQGPLRAPVPGRTTRHALPRCRAPQRGNTTVGRRRGRQPSVPGLGRFNAHPYMLAVYCCCALICTPTAAVACVRHCFRSFKMPSQRGSHAACSQWLCCVLCAPCVCRSMHGNTIHRWFSQQRRGVHGGGGGHKATAQQAAADWAKWAQEAKDNPLRLALASAGNVPIGTLHIHTPWLLVDVGTLEHIIGHHCSRYTWQ